MVRILEVSGLPAKEDRRPCAPRPERQAHHHLPCTEQIRGGEMGQQEKPSASCAVES